MVSSLLFVTLFSAQAATLGSNEAEQSSNTAGDPNRRVCETIMVTGSRLASRRVCMTAAQWEEQRQQTRDALERTQSNARTRGD